MLNINKTFWDNYYKNNNHDIKKSSSFSNFVYDNYINKYNTENVYLKIADLGAGNCRDSIFFSEKGNMCYAVDINAVIDKNYPNCRLIKKDVENVLKNKNLHTLTDIMYMRWFLHAMPYNKSEKIFKHAVHNLKPNGLICVEVRSMNDIELKNNSEYDENDKSYKTTHKRWLFTIDMCKKLANDHNCDILYCEEDYFSPNTNTETHNPLLIRIICQKKLLPYYEKSPNYHKYKHIIPKMRNYSIKSYSDMDKMNSILEKHNIKYVAVAGTLLGLNRHGGIIPWDNDIDIGFLPKEWKKLLSIKDKLEKNGLKFHKEGNKNNHCHFGHIDCFKLVLNNNFFEGPAKTYCYKGELKNVKKQIFGYTYIYSPFNSGISLKKRYGNYFNDGNVNDNFHFKDKSVKIFRLNHLDLSYQIK